MPIVTLISDLGTKDYYLAAVKGAILSISPATTIVDISHDIPPFDTFQAAFNLKNAFPHFPEGSIHIIGVDASGSQGARNLAIVYRNHIFLGTDNGIFSMIFEEEPQLMVEIQLGTEDNNFIFPLLDILAKAAGFVANGGNVEILGPKVKGLIEKNIFNPVVTGSEIRGTVIYVDGYGNVFTNITRRIFDEARELRNYAIYFTAANQPIRRISTHYDEVPEGERLALFSSSGYLQIAINKGVRGFGGGASQLFGLKLNHTIRIEFE
ncbi:MAG: SAM-dependent chlorinase/fluorinase [Bacteroidota bacterium]